MIEQLNVNNLQKVNAELATGFNRLQALMQIGESRTAQVVSVVAQPLRTPSPPPSSAQATRAPQAAPASTDSTRTAGTENRAATSPQSQAAATAYRIRVQVQGQTLELVSPKPLPAGSEVQLTRGSDNKIIVQTQSQSQSSGEKPSTPPPGTTVERPTNPARHERGGPGTEAAPRPSGRNETTPAAQNPARAEAARSEQQRLASLLPRSDQSVTARVLQSLPATAQQPAAPTATLPRPPAAAPSPPQQPPATVRTAPVTAAPPAPASPAPTISDRGNPTMAPPASSTPAQRVLLNIGGQQLEVLSPKPIPVGTEVRLSRAADGQLTLQLPAPRAQAVESALRQHLPRQQPPEALFNLLSQVNTSQPLRQAQPLLMSLIGLLLGRTLTNPSQPDPESVRQQLNNGGTLLESKLARGDTQSLPQDQKAVLLKLAQQLQQPANKELPTNLGERLTQLTQQAVSRVITNQIHSLGNAAQAEGDNEPTRALIVDLPVQGQNGQHETVQLRINEQSRGHQNDSEAPRRWRVELAFRMDSLPPMTAVLTLEQQRVSLVWQGESGTRSLLQPRLGGLQQRLEQLGLEVEVLGVREGNERPSGGGPARSLIDVET